MKRNLLLICLICIMIVQFCAGCNRSKVMEPTQEADEIVSEDKELEFSVGSVENNVYTNDFFGFKFSPDSEFIFEESYELQVAHNERLESGSPAILDDFEDNTICEIVESGYAVNIMECRDAGAIRKVSVNVIYDENVPLSRHAGTEGAILLQNTITESLMASGYQDGYLCWEKTEFLGKNAIAMSAFTNYNNKNLHMCHVFVEKDNFIAIIRVISEQDFVDVQNMLALFSGNGTVIENIEDGSQESAQLEDYFNISPIVGSVEGNTYINTILGFCCILPDGWNYRSLEEMEDYNNVSFSVESVNALMKENQSLCVMTADAEGGGSFNIRLCPSEVFGDIPLEAHYELLEDDLCAEITEAWSQYEPTIEEFKTTNVVFLEETVPHVEICLLTSVGRFYLQQITYPCGEYTMVISVSHGSPEAIQEVLNSFSVYKTE